MNEFQKKSTKIVKDIDKKTNMDHDIDTTFVHLVEELGEISRIIFNNKTKRQTNEKKAMEGEFADTLILLAHLATLHNIDLSESVNKKFVDLNKRFLK